MIGQRTTGQLTRIRLTTGGDGYTSPPAVTISGGGGSGAAAVACLNGDSVESVIITDPGSGYTSDPTVSIAGNAEAIATAYTGSLRPASFVRSRFNNVYAFDGMGRGLRWDGETATMQPVGLQKPATGPAVATGSAAAGKFVSRVEVTETGSGYFEPPAVTLSGGGAVTQAELRATVSGGVVTGFEVRDQGDGYTSQPTVTISGGQGSNAALTANVSGSVSSLQITSGGSGYENATIAVAQSNGLTGFNATVQLSGGVVSSVNIISSGSGATSDPTFAISGTAGAGAAAEPLMKYSVTGVNITNNGTDYHTAPAIRFVADPSDSPTAATATATVANGSLTGVTVGSGGVYAVPPTVEVAVDQAEARVVLGERLSGKYKCAIRYVDSTTRDLGGPLPSSISELIEVNADSGADSLEWTLTHPHLDDRVDAVELWRGTADQEVILFRIATISRDDAGFSGTYTDTLSDEDLADPDRSGYAVMPVVLPSGQVNARRFAVPPGHFGVAAAFQDRVWFAVDTSGRSPNSLLFSEIDEPESVPLANELVLQESDADTDSIVALIPLGSSLMIAQNRHLYQLQYVSQPIIDASVLLSAYRGIFNPRCWSILGGVAFIADSYGMYAFDGSNVEPASVPVDNYWTDGIIDFSQSDKFFVKCDQSTKTARFFYCEAGDTEPVRCLCYCTATKAWWTEVYGVPLTAGCDFQDGSRGTVVYGSESGSIYESSGYSDAGTAIDYSLKTGNFPLAQSGPRGIGVLYTPTQSDSDLQLKLYYNNASTSRDNAVSSDRGGGFVANTAGAELNMNIARSHLQDSNGFARAMYSGRLDESSSGSDRHVALEISGSQSTSGQASQIHAIAIEGAG